MLTIGSNLRIMLREIPKSVNVSLHSTPISMGVTINSCSAFVIEMRLLAALLSK
jgi:hypothetical protein